MRLIYNRFIVAKKPLLSYMMSLEHNPSSSHLKYKKKNVYFVHEKMA